MIIISDDLTGANDTGVQFVKQGKQTVVHLIPSPNLEFYPGKVNVINTDSRSLLPNEAYKQNKETAKKISMQPQSFVFKKVDSTLRGNIGQEIDGLMDELLFSYCAVAPAYPQNGRKTIGGYHLVHGVLLEDSELSKDVKFPMKESHIPTLLAEQTKRKIGLISAKTIRKGDLSREIKQLRSEGIEIIVFDGATDKDLQTVAHFLEKEENVLWVGSAGLAQALSAEGSVTQEEYGKRKLSSFPALTVAGSVSNVTREQIAYQQEQGVHVIELHPIELLKEDGNRLQSHFERTKNLLERKEDVVITTALSDEVAAEIEHYAKKLELDMLEVGNRIATKLGAFASRLIQGNQLSGLILTGGDIAYQTCLHLDIHSLEVMKEIEEGIPLSKVVDGPFAGTVIVTKAGAFGNESSLYHAMEEVKMRAIEE